MSATGDANKTMAGKAVRIIAEQLDILAEKSAKGHILSEEEVSILSTLVAAWVKIQDSKKKGDRGTDLTKRSGRGVATTDLLRYAEDS